MSTQESSQGADQSGVHLAEAIDILLQERVDIANLQTLDAIRDRLNEVHDKLQKSYDEISYQQGDAPKVIEQALKNFQQGSLGRLLDRLNDMQDESDE